MNNLTVAPSAAVFLSHAPNSSVVNLVPEIRELVAGAVVSLKCDTVSGWSRYGGIAGQG